MRSVSDLWADLAAATAGRVRRVPMNFLVRELLRSLPSRLKSPWVFPSASGESPLDSLVA